MSLTIDYRLTGTGWAGCRVTDAGASCELTASYLSDALGSLVLAGNAVLTDNNDVLDQLSPGSVYEAWGNHAPIACFHLTVLPASPASVVVGSAAAAAW